MLESNMEQASLQCMREDANLTVRQQSGHLLKVAVHFSVAPGATLSWRAQADSVLMAKGTGLWLTRISSPYDHWLAPGQTFRLKRGELIWLSTAGERVARASLTYALPARAGFIRRWLTRLTLLGLGPPTPR
jgi:hypothetical protein